MKQYVSGKYYKLLRTCILLHHIGLIADYPNVAFYISLPIIYSVKTWRIVAAAKAKLYTQGGGVSFAAGNIQGNDSTRADVHYLRHFNPLDKPTLLGGLLAVVHFEINGQ